ncbi:MAG TPA: EAL domain-containing protein [Gammaproteobacteria bacterium]|nr:EAL domain-containing protein [Gammaproteobacteria bacterium]
MLSGRSVKILIIEDSANDAELIAKQVTKGGIDCAFHRVETEEALRGALAEFDPDIVLSDFSLPQFDGPRVLDVVVAERPDLPFIFVSGTIGEVRAIDAMKRGATDYVLKTNLARLAPAIDRALREASVRNARRQAEEMLRDNERRLRDIVETSQDWIWELDAGGCFTFSSRSVEGILGFTPAELLGRDFRSFLHESDRDGAEGRLPAAPGESVSGVIARWRRKDGSWRWLERNAVALSGPNAELAGFRGTDRDITERRAQQIRITRLSRIHAMLSSINSAIVRIRDRDEMLAEACRIAVERGGYARAATHLLDPGRMTLKTVACAGLDSPALADAQISTLQEPGEEYLSMAALAVQSNEAVVCNDLAKDSQPVLQRRDLLELRLRSVIVLPLIVDGTAVGVLSLYAREAQIFDASERNVLSELAGNISFALQYFQKEDAVQFLSYFDPLTGLAKRTLFCERLGRLMQQADAEQRSVAVLAFDLERLGAINDSFGRHVGDRLLELIADRLRDRFPDTQRLAYLDGGSFAVAFTGLTDASTEGPELRDRVHELIREPIQIESHEIRVSARFGLACSPDDGDTGEMLVSNAEGARNHAKNADETYVHYALKLNTGVAERMVLERKLVRALELGEFVLHYQPIVHLDHGGISSVEALLRWQDPERGLVMPGEFIPTLESMRLIVEVGKWAMQQASRDCQHWRSHGFPDMRVAVNVSALQIRRREFADSVLEIVSGWRQGLCGLDLEITESMLMQDVQGCVRTLQQLREAGVRFAIDDFGTGYSSLAHLFKLPVDSLKIDRSFIAGVVGDPGSMTIVRTIITLAKEFHMTAIAEGVETVEQLELLRIMKCEMAQGYLFARPMPGEKLLNKLLARRGKKLDSAFKVETEAKVESEEEVESDS